MARTKANTLTINWKDFAYTVKSSRPYGGDFTIISYGPERMGGREIAEPMSGPEQFVKEHPEFFATSSTSKDEGYFYWGLLETLGPEGSEGGWQYQQKVRPGGARIGGATVDFVIDMRPRPLAVRIITFRFHLEVDATKHASDADQFFALEDQGYQPIDVPSDQYIHDESGLAVKRMVRRVIEQEPQLVPGSSIYYGE